MERLRTLSEAECYERCYGWRYTEDTVKLLPRGQTASAEPDDFGEKLRMLLELRLDAREPKRPDRICSSRRSRAMLLVLGDRATTGAPAGT